MENAPVCKVTLGNLSAVKYQTPPLFSFNVYESVPKTERVTYAYHKEHVYQIPHQQVKPSSFCTDKHFYIFKCCDFDFDPRSFEYHT